MEMLHRKLKVAFAVLVSTLGFTVSAIAGVNTFTPLGPEGGHINKVEFHPTNPAVAYLATASGFYRSTDAGENWKISGGVVLRSVVDFAVDPNYGDRIFLAEANTFGMLVSNDAGATVTRLTTFPITDRGLLNVEMSRDGTLYVTTDSKIFRSPDGGATWQERTWFSSVPLNMGLPVNALRVDPLDSNTLYVFVGSAGFRSVDGAATTWQPITFPAPVRDLVVAGVTPRLVFAAATTSGVIVSSNGGANWASAGLSEIAFTLTIDPSDMSVLYAGTYPTGLFRTANQGGNWINVHGNARSGEITSIAVNPTPLRTGLVLLGGIEGLARSSTAGPPWTQANKGFTATTIEKMLAVSASNRIYFNTNASGIFALDAGGALAQPVNPGSLVALRNNALGGNEITFGSFDLLAHGPSPDRLFVATNGGFARSNDGGSQWQWVNSLVTGAVGKLASHPLQPDALIASVRTGVHRVTNSGLTWVPVSGMPSSAEASVLVFSPSSPSVVYAGLFRMPAIPGASVPLGIYKSMAVSLGLKQMGVCHRCLLATLRLIRARIRQCT
jgi:hypothetical protein